MQHPNHDRLIAIGLDPGYAKLGVAVIAREAGREVWQESFCLLTPAGLPLPERLVIIGRRLEKLFSLWSPQILALEKLFVTKNQKTAMAVSEVRGLCLYLGARGGAAIAEYSPTQIKQTITGYGRSDKRQMMSLIPKLIKIGKEIIEDDEFDAVAVALTALAHYRPVP